LFTDFLLVQEKPFSDSSKKLSGPDVQYAKILFRVYAYFGVQMATQRTLVVLHVGISTFIFRLYHKKKTVNFQKIIMTIKIREKLFKLLLQLAYIFVIFLFNTEKKSFQNL
jgi:hypothetical protein